MSTPLTLQVAERRDEAEGIVALVLTDPQDQPLPAWQPGAHIDVVLDKPGAESLVRQYSLCGDPRDDSTYRIAVLREEGGRGGSIRLHEVLHRGQVVRVWPPRDTFEFALADRLVFVAGGIGITPILPMIRRAEAAGADWSLHYAGRREETMAFADELAAYGDRVHRYVSAGGTRMDLRAIAAGAARAGAPVFACGLQRMIDALDEAAAAAGCELRVERFVNDNPVDLPTDHTFEVELQLTGRTITVLPGESILDRVSAAGVPVPSSCRGGTCGTCETFVVSGEPDHRDAVLSAAERAENEVMMICVSRCKGERLVLEL